MILSAITYSQNSLTGDVEFSPFVEHSDILEDIFIPTVQVVPFVQLASFWYFAIQLAVFHSLSHVDQGRMEVKDRKR